MSSPATSRLSLHSWLHHSVIAVALLGLVSGFSQFAVTASLADVAAELGAGRGASIAEQAGLSATTVGLGLAVIRLASLAALPLSSVADRLGRRRVLLWCTSIGLALTALAAASPSFWWFVVIIAVGRPLLSATNAVGSVVASEETTSDHRTKALALAIAGYALGAGAVSVVRVPINSLLGLGFRSLFASTVLLLAAVPFISRLLHEPDRFTRLQEAVTSSGRPGGGRGLRAAMRERRMAVTAGVAAFARGLVSVHRSLRRRLVVLVLLTFAFNLVTGPVNTFLFFYAEGELGVSRASMAGAVLAAGPLGLVGLLVGRWVADRMGRRPAAIIPQVLLAAAGVLVYTGTSAALVMGYWAGIIVQAAYGTPFGALSTEIFPTSHRATAQGWVAAAGVLGAVAGLVVFGAVSDASGSFVVAALAVCLPCALATAGFLLLPETRGQELEDSAPEVV